MPNVKYAGDKTDIVGGFDPASLLPGSSNSLFTPPTPHNYISMADTDKTKHFCLVYVSSVNKLQ